MFDTNPKLLSTLLKDCHSGTIQLPDFQRSWVWDIDRITSLIASISRSFPVGALMALETGGDVQFKPRPIEGSPESVKEVKPSALLLDGQQRMTSLYQVTLRGQVVDTETVKHKPIRRWFYIDMMKALDPDVDRDEAIIPVPEDRKIRSDFGRKIEIDLSTSEAEYEHLMFPLTKAFDTLDWLIGFNTFWNIREGGAEKNEFFRQFNEEILSNFTNYQVPVITLGKQTSKEAVCVVFEKVNTGGKALDAFELITAMYAAEDYQLRDDWYGTEGHEGLAQRFRVEGKAHYAKTGILADVSNTDFLHVISLFHTRDVRRLAIEAGKTDKELPQITGKRQALLSLPLSAYKRYKDKAELGFKRAAQFVHQLHIFRTYDLPYQSQLIPLAAVLADLDKVWEHAEKYKKLKRWFWNGVFGELYGSTVDTRIAKDFVEVIDWLENDGPEPTTVSETEFRADRLKTMRMRLSAAYKGMNALLMAENAKDFITGKSYDHIVFFDEEVDIHHVFPQDWCKRQGIAASVYDSVINKTPLSARTNRIIGGVAPSEYLAKLQAGTEKTPPIDSKDLDSFLESHFITPSLIRADSFDAFMEDRQARLVDLIANAIGRQVVSEDVEVSAEWAAEQGEGKGLDDIETVDN
jgi:hypothetical protein